MTNTPRRKSNSFEKESPKHKGHDRNPNELKS